jgi:hypothetical protein
MFLLEISGGAYQPSWLWQFPTVAAMAKISKEGCHALEE